MPARTALTTFWGAGTAMIPAQTLALLALLLQPGIALAVETITVRLAQAGDLLILIGEVFGSKLRFMT